MPRVVRDDAFQANPEWAEAMEEIMPGARDVVSKVGGRDTPAGWTWEHASSSTAEGRYGVMRLVPTAQHTPGSPWWRILRPDLAPLAAMLNGPAPGACGVPPRSGGRLPFPSLDDGALQRVRLAELPHAVHHSPFTWR